MPAAQRVILTLACAPLLLAACHKAPEQEARDTAERYLRALVRRPSEGRRGLEAAYALLAAEFRATCDLACFRSRVAGDREAALDALQRLPAASVDLFAKWQPPAARDPHAARDPRGAAGASPEGGGKAAPEPPLPLPLLRHEGDGVGWRFSESPLDFYPQDTPERCLRSFLRALHTRRYAVLVRFLPRAQRAQMTAERMRAYLDGPGGDALRAQAEVAGRHLGEPFVTDSTGGEATLPVGERRAVRLLLESDAPATTPAAAPPSPARDDGAQAPLASDAAGPSSRWVISALQ